MKLALHLVCLLLLSFSVAVSAPLPDFSFHWNKYSEVQQVNGYLLGLTDYGITVLHYNETDDNYSQGETLLLDGRPLKMKVYGDSLLVQTLDSQIHIIDFHTPPELQLVGSIKPQTAFYDFALYNESIYLAGGYDGIQRVVTNNSDGAIVDYSNKGVLVTQVDILDNQLLALDEYNGLMTYDIGGTGFGTFDEYLYLDQRAYRFGRLDDTSLIVMNKTAHALFAAKENDHLTIGGTFAISSQPLRTFVTDNFIILVSARTIEKYSRADFTFMESATLTSQRVEGTIVSEHGEQVLIVPGADRGLSRIDLANLTITTNALAGPGKIDDIAATNKELLIAPESDTVEFYQLDEQDSPQRVYWFRRIISSVAALTANGDSALALYLDGFIESIEIQEEPPVVYLHHWNLRDAGTIRELDYVGPIGGSGAYLLARNITDIAWYDIDNASTVTPTSFFFDENINDVAFHDSLLAVAHGYTIELSSINSSLAPTLLTTQTFHFPVGRVALHNERMITAAGTELALWDISDPTRPSVLDAIELAQSIADIELVANHLIAVGPGGAYVINLADDQMAVNQIGELPGTMLAYVDSVLFTSDGRSIHGYRTVFDIDPPEIIPETYALYQNFPNPFNASTTIQFDLPEPSQVSIEIYNSLGRRVQTLVDRSMAAGQHTVRWDGENSSGESVASGIYFYRLKTNGREATRKMVLLK